MNTITLFRIYVQCRDNMERYTELYGKQFGIAVSTNMYALKWQRSAKLANKIESRLMGPSEYKRCAICGYYLEDGAKGFMDCTGHDPGGWHEKIVHERKAIKDELRRAIKLLERQCE